MLWSPQHVRLPWGSLEPHVAHVAGGVVPGSIECLGYRDVAILLLFFVQKNVNFPHFAEPTTGTVGWDQPPQQSQVAPHNQGDDLHHS